MMILWRQFHSPAKVFIGTLLLLLLCLATYSSSGIIRNGGNTGGGDEDGGSGLGGTGRTINSLEPGGSGFGGTGFRPYLGFSESESTTELVIVDQTTALNQSAFEPAKQADDAAAPIPVAASRAGTLADLPQQLARSRPMLKNPVTVVSQAAITRDSGAISIEESMQWQLDSQVLALNSAIVQVSDATKAAVKPEIETDLTQDSAVDSTVDSAKLAAASKSAAQISWSDLAAHFNVEPQDESGQDSSGIARSEQVTMQRPDRVVRPALPPIQRIRPVQRAGVLPPRIRPLRL